MNISESADLLLGSWSRGYDARLWPSKPQFESAWALWVCGLEVMTRVSDTRNHSSNLCRPWIENDLQHFRFESELPYYKNNTDGCSLKIRRDTFLPYESGCALICLQETIIFITVIISRYPENNGSPRPLFSAGRQDDLRVCSRWRGACLAKRIGCHHTAARLTQRPYGWKRHMLPDGAVISADSRNSRDVLQMWSMGASGRRQHSLQRWSWMASGSRLHRSSGEISYAFRVHSGNLWRPVLCVHLHPIHL